VEEEVKEKRPLNWPIQTMLVMQNEPAEDFALVLDLHRPYRSPFIV
jgi:hypothetical protein